MVSAAVLCLAVLCWPTIPARARLHTLHPTNRTRRLRRPPRPSSITLSCTAAAGGWLLAGIPGAAAAALAAVTAQRRWRAKGDRLRSLTAIDGLVEAIRSLVAALRAGAHPADAAESAAADAHPSAATSMRAIAAAARLDGDMHRALAATSSSASTALSRLSRAWALAHHHGLPLAEVLDAVSRDLDQRVRFARQVMARMAGPRASATVLALLPALGIALGESMGAHPIHVLTTTSAGQGLLLAGVALQCAGVAWCARLTNQAVLT